VGVLLHLQQLWTLENLQSELSSRWGLRTIRDRSNACSSPSSSADAIQLNIKEINLCDMNEQVGGEGTPETDVVERRSFSILFICYPGFTVAVTNRY